ncbi:MAG: hypothetical protein HFG48_02705 [Bacilli bacterium]|nr:hypothetical protein [Bacilli bacterium]
MEKFKKNIISSIITIILGLIYYYVFLPAINIQSLGFWLFIIVLLFFYTICMVIASVDEKGNIKKMPKSGSITALCAFGIIGLIILTNLVLSPIFFSKDYSKRISIDETKDFNDNIKEVDFNSLPLLDKDSSQKLGDRVMGQMPELVSQFYVSDLYTQINYNSDIVRVTPLEYDGLIKYFTNHKDGVKGYITVNSVSGESKLVKLDKGMKYMPSAYFNENLERHLRFSYPTLIFGESQFELDNEGHPYWITPIMKYTGIGLKRDVSGIIMTDPITGKSKKYKTSEIPAWIDHVYSADLIIEQVDDWGQYKNGFMNSIFGQKNVVATTTGYNYTVMNDDVFLYTGITSKASDEANIGFILTNMRTKETNFYAVPGAEEYSAMDSAQGQVQQMNYKASFPLLINLNNRPTYLISLKDNAGLVKMYAFVDVVDYQKVVVTDSSKGIKKAAENYLNNIDIEMTGEYKSKNIKILSITTANLDGNTYYYFTDQDSKKYKASLKVAEAILPFLKEGKSITISYIVEKELTEVVKIEHKN